MKKILSVLCSLAVLSTCGVTTAFATEETTVSTETSSKSAVIIGDVNGDGVVDVNDAVGILEDYAVYILAESIAYDEGNEDYTNPKYKPEGYSDEEFAATLARYNSNLGDIDGDGQSNPLDAAFILEYSAYKYVYPDSTIDVCEYIVRYKNGEFRTETEADDQAKNKVYFEGGKLTGSIREDEVYDSSIDYAQYTSPGL